MAWLLMLMEIQVGSSEDELWLYWALLLLYKNLMCLFIIKYLKLNIPIIIVNKQMLTCYIVNSDGTHWENWQPHNISVIAWQASC